MNQQVLLTLEYDKIKNRLMDYAMSYLGRQRIEAMGPSTQLRQIAGWLEETEDALAIVAGSSSVPIPSLNGIEMVMMALGKGQTLHVEQIGHVERFLVSTEQLRQYMARKVEVAPRVSRYAQSIVSLEDLREEIRLCVDYGTVLDSASDELARVRKQIAILEERVRRKIEAALVKYRTHLQESFHSTRNGRPVLPIKRDSKRLVKGTILDESASGQTVYIEPEEVAHQQDELIEARFAEQREIARVLNMLTEMIAEQREVIARNLEVIGHYDFVFAKAKLAKAMGARRVAMNDRGRIRLCGARHPMLGAHAHPLEFHIGMDFKALVITGPNTGGKTVTLKTVGLLTIMAQSGLLVPADEGTELSIFHEVYVDIGDGQSIEGALSTFSAHVTSVIDILRGTGPKSLVLLDELASGTDPGEGIGLSIALLEALYRAGSTIVATTHFNEIKRFAKAADGFENARMEFDTATLQPLYRLRIGEAGESYALVIAERLGVPKEIVQRARALAVTGFAKVGQSNPAHVVSDPSSAKAPQGDSAVRDYLPGDRVWIHPLKRTGIFVGPADARGNVIVMVKGERMTFNRKRIAPYLTREELYPDIDSYDLDIVLESKDARRKRKIMSKRHVEGLSIDHPGQPPE